MPDHTHRANETNHAEGKRASTDDRAFHLSHAKVQSTEVSKIEDEPNALDYTCTHTTHAHITHPVALPCLPTLVPLHHPGE